MKRSLSRQNTHNQKVREVAVKLTRQGWNVRADIPGYGKPRPIGNERRVPDIETTKRGHRRIVEVETPDTIDRDKKQLEIFRRHAGQKPNTTFDVVVTD